MEEINQTEPAKRPVFLTVLCVLTFISSGFGALVALVTPLMADTIIAFLQASPNYDEAALAENVKVIQAGWGYYAPTFLLIMCSLIGAVLMWNLKKIGFHFYAASNLAMLFLPTLILGMSVSWFGLFLTIGFIVMYGLHLKFMS